jgi:hypothetical protein
MLLDLRRYIGGWLLIEGLRSSLIMLLELSYLEKLSRLLGVIWLLLGDIAPALLPEDYSFMAIILELELFGPPLLN